MRYSGLDNFSLCLHLFCKIAFSNLPSKGKYQEYYYILILTLYCSLSTYALLLSGKDCLYYHYQL